MAFVPASIEQSVGEIGVYCLESLGAEPFMNLSSPTPNPLLAQIMAGLRERFGSLNRHYQVWFTDSGCECCCGHEHEDLTDAAVCAMVERAGSYVVCVEFGQARELTQQEAETVGRFRYGGKWSQMRVAAKALDFEPESSNSSRSQGTRPTWSHISKIWRNIEITPNWRARLHPKPR